ncbi:MAG: FAD-binding oxidoreductase [Clostridia bacterium]
MERFAKSLADIVGPANVLSDPQDTKPYFVDWRRQYSGSADCVVRPASTAEVAGVVSLCAGQGVAIVPQGGNTGLCGGSVPAGERRQIVLSLSRMNKVRELDALNDTITVEAGCVLAAVQEAARQANRFFPLSLAAEGSCQIGGNLSTNAGGVNVLRYGMARDQVLGLEVVLPDGRVWNGLRGLRKDNTGYDLKQLFLGAEGTLGIITAAVLRLQPAASAQATAWIAIDSPRAAVELLASLRTRLGDRLSAFELLSRNCVEAVLAHAAETQDPLSAPHPWYVLAEISDSGEAAELRERVERSLFECAESGALRDAVLAQSVAQGNALWRIRETVPEAQFTNVKHDISVAVSRIPELIDRIQPALEAAFPQVRSYIFGHVGDGNLHYNVGPEALVAERPTVNRIVYEAVDALNGSISAEHGLGQLKREEIRRHKSPVELELMAALKRTLDPAGLMNPGKVI